MYTAGTTGRPKGAVLSQGASFWNAVNLVSPDLAEDKVWPYFWQEREYIITTPCYYIFDVLAVKESLKR